ncbi:helix-turn-helix domain-containing protein [Bacillus sp. B-jedd]|uniref:helix-turn-helix domain-containing protein n=1 Tax=Bacillus sp. B-jedd TaxID=1476857 RepID=UPI0005155C50|nr:helix-turn-helix domain-containing protein [Bacillus sp. B-jedd]CEG28629.1 putative transcriptional regulator [Bacillus sp. B-jedd]
MISPQTEAFDLDLHKAMKLLEINKLLTQSLDLKEVLRNLIAAASELVSSTDTFIIYLYDESDEKLKFVEGKGVDAEAFREVSISLDESIAGRVFTEKKAILFKSEQEIDESMTTMSPENYCAYLKGVYNRKIKSAFCVPIIYKGRCFGVLVVDNFSHDGLFSMADLEVIKIIADQSAIAIEHSRVYTDLLMKHQMLADSISIHKKFYQVVIDGNGMESILSLLEELIRSRVVYHETAIVEKGERDFPIVRGQEILGMLELEKPFAYFAENEQMIIEHASLAMALEITKDSALIEQELHFRNEVFNQLIHEQKHYDVNRLLHYLKWERTSGIQCVIVEGAGGSLWQNNKLKEKQWIVLSIEKMLERICKKCFVVTHMFQLILLLPSEAPEEVLQKVINGIERILGGENVLIGIGRKTAVQQLASSYQEALRSVSYAKTSKTANVVEYSKLGMERLFHEMDQQMIDMYIEDKIGRLLETDPVLLNTLLCFIRNNKNHKDTAAEMHIHSNTLYYRLRKVEEVLGLSLGNEKEWVDLMIATQLYVATHKV